MGDGNIIYCGFHGGCVNGRGCWKALTIERGKALKEGFQQYNAPPACYLAKSKKPMEILNDILNRKYM